MERYGNSGGKEKSEMGRCGNGNRYVGKAVRKGRKEDVGEKKKSK